MHEDCRQGQERDEIITGVCFLSCNKGQLFDLSDFEEEGLFFALGMYVGSSFAADSFITHGLFSLGCSLCFSWRLS